MFHWATSSLNGTFLWTSILRTVGTIPVVLLDGRDLGKALAKSNKKRERKWICGGMVLKMFVLLRIFSGILWQKCNKIKVKSGSYHGFLNNFPKIFLSPMTFFFFCYGPFWRLYILVNPWNESGSSYLSLQRWWGDPVEGQGLLCSWARASSVLLNSFLSAHLSVSWASTCPAV